MPKKHLVFIPIAILATLSLTLSSSTSSVKTLSQDTLRDLASACQNKEDNWQCWEESIDATINTYGVASGFDLIEAISSVNPELANGCHGFAHTLGRSAYTHFAEGRDFSLSAKVSYCNWGFYHGFMEALSEGGKIGEAKSFCNLVDSKLRGESSGASLACYHGVGHGAANNHDPKNWGSPQAMIDEAIGICQKASGNDQDLDYCLSGVFMGINELTLAKEYELSVKSSDPLWLCPNQMAEFQMACYNQGYVLLNSLFKEDLSLALKFVEAIPEDNYSQEATKPVIASFYSFEKDNLTQLSFCQTIQKRLRLSCIEGMAQGIMEKGNPGAEYLQSTALCQEKSLTVEEKNACYKHVFLLSSRNYPKQKTETICEGVPVEYRTLCPY